MNEQYMEIALELAKKGEGKVSPNPMVGAVIVKNGNIIGRGYHMKYKEKHAEINAIDSTNESIENSTMYVTLEPCSHYGNTPPCVDRIIESKISKVVIGSLDPNPLVSGNGVKKLRENNIEVVTGVLEDKCKRLNEVFMKFIIKKRPFVIMKCAMSIDGKISTKDGESKWISCEESRLEVHKLRGLVKGIMVGVDTVVKDDPLLTCRIAGYSSPTRIVVDSKLRIPIHSKVIKDTTTKTIIATTSKANRDKLKEIEAMGVRILICKEQDSRVDINDLMEKIGELSIDSVLLEGGATLNYSALESNIVDKIHMYIAPKIIGGNESKTPVGGIGIDILSDAYKLINLNTKTIGNDIFIEGYIDKEDEEYCLQV